MLKRQLDTTPAPQWVRVVGGFTEHQLAEKRLPTLSELNAVSPDTPVFILHLCDRALLIAAALRAVGYTRDTLNLRAAKIERDAAGNPTGLLLAQAACLGSRYLWRCAPRTRRLRRPGPEQRRRPNERHGKGRR